MSIKSAQSKITTIQREIEQLHKKLGNEASKEAQKTKQISNAQSAMSRTKSMSTLKNKANEIDRLNRDIAAIQKRKADCQKKIGDKTVKLHAAQNDLMKEQAKQQKSVSSRLKNLTGGQSAFATTRIAELSSTMDKQAEPVEYDAFISHASEDKDEVVRELAQSLSELGFKIWYDEFTLRVGDSLRKSIDTGLANARFGIVVLSPDFFAKQWTEYELNGLVAKEMVGGKVVLPIWHRVSKDDVLKYSPPLADKMGLSTSIFTIQELAEKLSEVLTGE